MKLKIPHPKTIKFFLSKFLYKLGILPSIIYEDGIFYYQPTSIMGEKLYWMGGSELKEISLLKTFLKSDSVVIDIGANVGGHTVAFATVCKYGQVFAFEPQPDTLKILFKNCKRFSNTRISSYAISDHNGKITFHQTADSGYSTIVSREVTGNVFNKYTKEISHFNVETRTLDYLITKDVAFMGIEKIDLIKIDVEGAEEKVIDGALNTIKKFCPIIMCEVNGGPDAEEEVFKKVEKISSLGYRAFVVSGDKLIPFKTYDMFNCNYFFLPNFLSSPSIHL